jgi:hypothetical protein
MRADLRQTRGCIEVGAELIVEAPRAHRLAQPHHLGRVPRVSALRHHAVEARQVLGDRIPLAVVRARANERTAAIDERRRRTHDRSVPHALAFDFGILSESRSRRRRQTEIDRVTEFVGGEAELHAHRSLADRALHRVIATQHRSREAFGPRP